MNLTDEKTRRVGIVCNPVGPTQAEIQRRIQECFDNNTEPTTPTPDVPFRFSWSHDNPDKMIITNPEEFGDEK